MKEVIKRKNGVPWGGTSFSLLPEVVYAVNSFWKAEEPLTCLPELARTQPCQFLVALTERSACCSVHRNVLEWLGDKLLEVAGMTYATVKCLHGNIRTIGVLTKGNVSRHFFDYSKRITTNLSLRAGFERCTLPLYVRHREWHRKRILPGVYDLKLEKFALDSKSVGIASKEYADLVEATTGILAVDLPEGAVDIFIVQDLCRRFGIIFPGVDDDLARHLRRLSIPHTSPPTVFYAPPAVVEKPVYEILQFAFADSRFLNICVAVWYDEVGPMGTFGRFAYCLEKTGRALLAYLIALWMYWNMPQDFSEGDLAQAFQLIAQDVMEGAISKDLIGLKAWFLQAEKESNRDIRCPTARKSDMVFLAVLFGSLFFDRCGVIGSEMCQLFDRMLLPTLQERAAMYLARHA